jgi:hypothetical protein
MICAPCRGQRHHECPEIARQLRTDLTGTEKAGSRLCDCAHEPGSVLRADRKPDPRRGA